MMWDELPAYSAARAHANKPTEAGVNVFKNCTVHFNHKNNHPWMVDSDSKFIRPICLLWPYNL